MALHKPGRRSSPNTKSASTLILDVSVSTTRRNKCLSFKSLSRWFRLQQPELKHLLILICSQSSSKTNLSQIRVEGHIRFYVWTQIKRFNKIIMFPKCGFLIQSISLTWNVKMHILQLYLNELADSVGVQHCYFNWIPSC